MGWQTSVHEAFVRITRNNETSLVFVSFFGITVSDGTALRISLKRKMIIL